MQGHISKQHMVTLLNALLNKAKEDKAYWIYDSFYGGFYKCSKCGYEKGSKDDICPKCGSIMIDREER